MPPKYKKKSAFYYFLEKVKEERHYSRLSQAQDEADKRWKAMSSEERIPYQIQAKRDVKPNQNAESDMKRLDREAKETALQNQNDIKHLINKLVQSNTLTTEYFHIMHFNNFCYCNSNKKHYPAEVAIVRFNLNNGLLRKNMFTKLIKPGRIPVGYTLTVRQKAEETHNIPDPPIDSECNLKYIISELHSFLAVNQNPTTKEYPLIFVKDCDETETNQILTQLCEDYNIDRSAFRVCSLQYFFYKLRNAHREVWPSLCQSIAEIEKDSYDCIPSLACDVCNYHKNNWSFVYCSKCIVTRLVYIICDNCCIPWNITMKPGYHIPLNSLPVDVEQVPMDNEYATRLRQLRNRPNVPPRANSDSSSSSSSSDNGTRANYRTSVRENTTYSQIVTSRPTTSEGVSRLRRPNTPSLSVSGMYHFMGFGRGRGIIKK